MRSHLLFLHSLFVAFLVLTFAGSVFAQPVEIPFYHQGYQLESGYHNGSGDINDDFVNAYSTTISLQDVPWLRIHFSDIHLGENSYMIIRSTLDDYWQRLDAVSIQQWYNHSAFFNGGTLEIELYVHPMDDKVHFNIDELIVGEWADPPLFDSQCGPTDDRILSNQPATARLINIGCTAWIIPNGKFVSAGHCLDGSGANVVEFQVPPSLPGGTIQHPPPEDQYSVDVSTKIFTNGGVGNDWGVFEVFPNSITGLMPKEAQGAYWPLVQNLGPDSIRITGYGVDNGVTNQVQQTHVGPNAGSSGTTMRYVTDTEGGNSGSPVIDEATQTAVGVHTHGGCSTSGTGNNNGTSLFHAAFWAAVDQGAGGCPVGNPTNPDPANNEINVPITLTELTWSNGAGTVTTELYFGTDPSSLTLVQSGSLDSSWTITSTLNYETNYYWQVIEVGDTCNTPGPTWTFRTQRDPAIVCVFFDDFEGTLSNWTINNLGGTCDWMQFFPPYPNAYTMPNPNTGGVLSADSDECGNGSTMNTEAVIGPFDASLYQSGFLQFDNDFRTLDTDDHCYVEVSTDGGSTWTIVWSQLGTDLRQTTEFVDITAEISLQPQFWVKFRSVQPGWDWWWTIDNVEICLDDQVPVELSSFTASANDDNVTLSWTTATETNNQGFQIERSNEGEFESVGYVPGRGTTTEVSNYTFVDENVAAGSYSYRLKQMDYDGTYEYSQVIEVDVNVPAEFAMDQNYPNPFNPSTKINFRLAADSKVTLKVFDVLGQEVITLLNKDLSAGSHIVDFDASGINSGTYFYRIDATGIDGTNFTDVKKMILMK